jgi:hypothetical protein
MASTDIARLLEEIDVLKRDNASMRRHLSTNPSKSLPHDDGELF